MRRIGGHAGVWLAAGLWAAAAPLNVALIAATVAPPELPDAPAPAAFHAERHPGESDAAGGTDEPRPAEGAAPPEAIPEAGDPPIAPRARPGNVDTVIRTVVHEVAPGDSLMSVTRGYLGSAARWREVAEANEVPPPYVLEPGRSLRIPMARSARTEARLELLPPREPGPGPAPAAAPVKDVNPPPARTFESLGKGLRISRPLAEAYPWDIPLHAALAFAGVALGAAVLAFAGAKRRMDPA
ncbi:MAG: LysM peptidoglycan-binding domain-containing protein, partial [Planctomycetota bacterium]